MKLLIVFIFTPFLLASQGGYTAKPVQIKPYQPKADSKAPSAPADKNYKYVEDDPFPKKERDIKSLVFDEVKRKGVTINNLNYQKSYFTVKGTYKTEIELSNFVKEITKRQRSTKKPEIKKFETSFAGSRTKNYEITFENLF